MDGMDKIAKAIEDYLARTGYAALDLRCALFDMDGVLFDSMPRHAASWVQVMAENDIEFTEQDAYMNEGRTGASTIKMAMARCGRPVATDEEVKRIYASKCNLFNAMGETPTIAGADRLAQTMREAGLALSIVTGSAQHSLLQRIETAYPGLFELDKIVTALDVKHGKPDPEPYMMGQRKMGAMPWQTLVVENAPLGVEAGNASGAFTVAINTGPLDDKVLTDSGADLLFATMDEFRTALPELTRLTRRN